VIGILGVAIVGCGIIGRNHADAIQLHPGLRVTALVDPVLPASETLAAHIATGSEAPARYPTLAGALAESNVDLVAICTPSGLHSGAAEEAMAAGKHVLIEKPLEVSLPAARRLAELAVEAGSRGQVCSVVSQRRFEPVMAATAQSIVDGRLGRITSAVATVPWWRTQDYYDSAQWRGTWAFDGGGAVMNQGVHTVDLLVWLLGAPVEVFARTARLAHERIEVEDVAVATIRFASGALAVFHATTGAYPGLPVRLQVHGTLGSAVVDGDGLSFFPDTGESVPAENDFVAGHLRQYADVVTAIEERRPAGITVHDGLIALAVVKAIDLSATLGAPVLVDDVLRGELDDVPMTTQEVR
jgi:UDP-N-acetyl-2-amino-2-deoxyglucuronate dehydrogenase